MDATATFPVRYHAARTALATAQRHTTTDPELDALLQARFPEKFAVAQAQIAEIAATIPALQAEFDRLDALACRRCSGSGEYGGASRYQRHGVKFCFSCGGRGTRG